MGVAVPTNVCFKSYYDYAVNLCVKRPPEDFLRGVFYAFAAFSASFFTASPVLRGAGDGRTCYNAFRGGKKIYFLGLFYAENICNTNFHVFNKMTLILARKEHCGL